MADETNPLEWLETAKSIAVTINFEDPTPTPAITITPGDPDALITAGKQQAEYIGSKEDLIDMRAAIAQSILAVYYMLQNTTESLTKFKQSNDSFTADITKRTVDVEKRMTTQEATYKDLITQLTDADKGAGAAEVIAARTSSLYGSFDSLAARLDAAEARTASLVPDMDTLASIPVNLGRQVPISVTYYEYAIGTETDGLGTGPYGLGGSTPAQVTVTTTWPDANTAQVAVPVAYADVIKDGTLKTMADGSWTITSGYKTLRFVADAAGTGGDAAGGDTSTPS